MKIRHIHGLHQHSIGTGCYEGIDVTLKIDITITGHTKDRCKVKVSVSVSVRSIRITTTFIRIDYIKLTVVTFLGRCPSHQRSAK